MLYSFLLGSQTNTVGPVEDRHIELGSLGPIGKPIEILNMVLMACILNMPFSPLANSGIQTLELQRK